MKISYEWLQSFFEDGALPSAEEIAQQLIFHAYEVEGVAEVNGTAVLDVDVLPNRAADSLSHRGIAHEVSALLNIPMKRDPLREHIELVPTTETVRVTLDPDASCTYYIAAHITGVKVGESPDWLKERLEAIGQKSINNIVDASNYVQFELGRPTHVFDAQKFAGERPCVGTRLAKEGETITLLGGEEVTLPEKATLIIDANADIPVAVGGIKGGAHAEVDEHTTDILIETANFNPKQTRLTAQAMKLRTDASTRFENNMADELAHYGVHALVQLILDIAGGELQGYAYDGALDTQQPTVAVTAARTSKLLGVSINESTMKDIFGRLGFAYERKDDTFHVTAPFERRDIRIAEDVIEEVGRVYGYNNIESAPMPPLQQSPQVHKKYAYAERIREALTGAGYSEVHLYSLRDSGDITLRNALASDKDHLRSNLADGVRDALDKNEKHIPLLGLYDAVRIFEIGNVFPKSGESTHAAVGVRVAGAKKKSERTKDELLAAKKILEETLGITLPEPDGEVLEFSLDDVLDSVPDVDTYPDASRVQEGVAYQPPSQYPFVLRDIAVWVPEGTEPQEVLVTVEKHGDALLVRADLFDTFTKDGRTSYAFHLVFQSRHETLTDGKVGDIMAAIEQDIANKNGWEVR